MVSETSNRGSSVDAAILRGQKQKALAAQNSLNDEQWAEGFENNRDEEWNILEEINELRKNHSKTELFKRGVYLGEYLRNRIDETRFDGASFFAVLTLSIIKDFSDFLTLGMAGTITTFVITPALFIVFLMRRGNILKRYALKRFIFAPIFELIPFVNIYPTYIMLTIMLKLRMDKKVRKLKEDIDILNKELMQT